MTQNTTAMQRGIDLVSHTISSQQNGKDATRRPTLEEMERGNRLMRRLAAKQRKRGAKK